MNRCDALVVGAGIAGASVAWRLACAGLQVRLVERESQPGYHSTGRSAAMFMESYGPPGVRALTRAGRSFYLAPPPGFAQTALLHPRQALFVATAAQREALAQLEREVGTTGTQLQRLSAGELQQAAPLLRPGLFEAALLDPHGFDIDVHALLQGYLRGAKSAGVEVTCGVEPTGATREGDGWQVTLSDGADVTCGTVVNAAGAWVDQVATRFGAQPIGIEPRRRSAFTFRPEPAIEVHDWPLVGDVNEGWYLKPDAGQLLGSSANADPVAPHDVQPEVLDIAIGIDRIQAATTLTIRRPTATWAGLRSFVHDGEIVIGFDSGCPGFFWLAAQGGYGIQSAAGASLLAATLIQRLPLPQELLDYGVDPAVVSPARLR